MLTKACQSVRESKAWYKTRAMTCEWEMIKLTSRNLLFTYSVGNHETYLFINVAQNNCSTQG